MIELICRVERRLRAIKAETWHAWYDALVTLFIASFVAGAFGAYLFVVAWPGMSWLEGTLIGVCVVSEIFASLFGIFECLKTHP